MIELFVENQQVDINAGFSTLLTYAIDDVKDFGAKNTSFSKTIILPGTKRNNQIFGNIFSFNRSTQYNPLLPNNGYNYNAAISAKAMIFADNIQVFKGVLRMMEIVVDNDVPEYEVAVFGELGGFIYDLGNKKLEDLDFSAYDLTYSLANIVASWDNTPGTGVYFPLIDYGTYSIDKHNWEYRTFRPALYAAEYIAKIFAASTYRYEGAIFGTDRFLRMAVPHNTKGLYKTSDADLLVSSTGYSLTQTEGEFTQLTFNTLTTLGSFSDVAAPNQIFVYTGVPALNGLLTVDIDVTYTNAISYWTEISLQKNGVTIGTQTTRLDEYGGPINKIIHFEVDNYGIVTGDNLSVFINTLDNGAGLTIDMTFNSAQMKYGSPSTTLVQLNLGEQLPINDSIPKNILQKDFFSSIVKLYNMYVYEDRDNAKLLRIAPFPDFYYLADAESAADWTAKLDRSKPLRIKPLSELNARYYEFKYKSDNDFYNEQYRKRYNENYGDRIYDSQYEFAEESSKVEIIFSGTPLVGYPSEEKVYSTIFKSSNAVEETIDSNIRLLLTKKVTGVTSWNIVSDVWTGGGPTVLASYTDYGYAGHLDDPDAPGSDLGFGVPKELFFTLLTGALNVNQFNLYYSGYMAEITDPDSKLLTGTFRLTRRDIFELDFARYVWIDGGLFRINKIVDYNATDEDICTVELLKVLNTIY